MSYESTVYRILIASPSDVDEEREVVARIIQDWNALNSFNKKIVLLPVRWETHSSPSYGTRPQEIINRQIVDECDMLIGFFWTKIGTPTGEDISGTIEEIHRVSNANKPVMLYFSKRGKDPSLIDLSQLQALNTFKEEVYKIALVESYNTIVDFRDKVSRHLEMKIRELQENENDHKDHILFSFIDSTSGEFISNKHQISIERIEISEQKIISIEKNDKRVKNSYWGFKHTISSYLNKRNNIPIIIGIKNNSNRIYGNVIIELKIKSSEDDQLIIHSMNTSQRNDFSNNLSEYDFSKESELTIRRLFKSNITKINSQTWEYNTMPFTLLPNKMGVIDTLILLFPKISMNINFQITMFSENLLKPIENSCNLSINCTTREMSKKEIDEIIDKMPDYDDLPF